MSEARFRYEDADLLEYFRRASRMGLLLIGVAWLALAGWLGYSAAAQPEVAAGFARDPFLLALLGLGLASAAWAVWGAPRVTLKRAKPLFVGEHALRVDAKGLTLSGPRGETRALWDEVEKVREGKRTLELRLGGRRVLVLPKAGLGQAGDALRARLVERGLAQR